MLGLKVEDLGLEVFGFIGFRVFGFRVEALGFCSRTWSSSVVFGNSKCSPSLHSPSEKKNGVEPGLYIGYYPPLQ